MIYQGMTHIAVLGLREGVCVRDRQGDYMSSWSDLDTIKGGSDARLAHPQLACTVQDMPYSQAGKKDSLVVFMTKCRCKNILSGDVGTQISCHFSCLLETKIKQLTSIRPSS